ncbi:MAG: hypothetical protein ABEI99_00305 [Halobaculum sp.]
MVEFRPVPAGDQKAFQRTLQYAFSPDRGPTVDVSDDDWPPTLSEPRGVYDEDELGSVCKLYTLSGRVRGTENEVGGLGATRCGVYPVGSRRSPPLTESVGLLPQSP